MAGLTHVFPNGGEKLRKYILETTGSGVALFDYDNDGFVDIFIASGEGAPSRLYRNLGKLRFEEVNTRVGITRDGWAQGACAADYDNDGFTDLFVTYWGKNSLYRNIQGRRFESVRLPETKTRYSTGCVFFDYDRDGDLDLFITNYLEFDFASTPLPGANPYCFYRGAAVSCGPRGLPFVRNMLYRNDRGSFTDVSETSGITKPDGHYSLGALATDVDRDGWPDLYVACDQTPSLLYMNQRDGTFKEEGLLRGVALDENGKALSGMGVAAADYDNDGAIDLFRTNFSDERVTLYRNRGDGMFDETTSAAGLWVEYQVCGMGNGVCRFR
jgi:enediyne biosynthesis protein E4